MNFAGTVQTWPRIPLLSCPSSMRRTGHVKNSLIFTEITFSRHVASTSLSQTRLVYISVFRNYQITICFQNCSPAKHPIPSISCSIVDLKTLYLIATHDYTSISPHPNSTTSLSPPATHHCTESRAKNEKRSSSNAEGTDMTPCALEKSV